MRDTPAELIAIVSRMLCSLDLSFPEPRSDLYLLTALQASKHFPYFATSLLSYKSPPLMLLICSQAQALQLLWQLPFEFPRAIALTASFRIPSPNAPCMFYSGCVHKHIVWNTACSLCWEASYTCNTRYRPWSICGLGQGLVRLQAFCRYWLVYERGGLLEDFEDWWQCGVGCYRSFDGER